MPPNRVIAVLSSCALLQIHAFENCVFAEPLLDVQHGLLHLLFALQLYGLLGLLLLDRRIVGEKIHLLKGFFVRGGCLIRYTGGGEVKPAHQQVPVDDTVKQLQRSGNNAPGGGGILVQIGGTMSVFGDGATIAVLG